MPGSPPTSKAEPATKPPPTTRSNSLRPVMQRGGSTLAPSSACSSMMRPRIAPAASPEPFGPAFGAASSTIEFHSPQASQRPCQRWLTAPQF